MQIPIYFKSGGLCISSSHDLLINVSVYSLAGMRAHDERSTVATLRVRADQPRRSHVSKGSSALLVRLRELILYLK